MEERGKIYINDVRYMVLYLILILYIGVKPISMILTYIGIPNDIKQGVWTTLLLVIYIFMTLIHCYKDGLKFYELESLTLVLVVLVYMSSYRYVSNYRSIVYSDEPLIIMNGSQYFMNFIKRDLMYYICFALIGKNLLGIYNLKNEKKIQWINKILYIAISVLLLVASAKKGGIFSIIFKADVENSYYILIGDAFSLLSVFLINNIKYKKIYIINSLFWLYKIGSRTSLMCFILFLCIYMFKNFRMKVYVKFKSLFYIGLSFFVLAFMCIFIATANIELDERMVKTFSTSSIEEDGSYKSRNEINEKNMEDLKNIWVTGHVFRELDIGQSKSAYSHNLLSFWIEYGIIPFTLLVVLILKSVYMLAINLSNKDEFVKFNSYIVSIYILSVVFSRSYVYPYIWLIIFSTASLKKYRGNVKCKI